MVDVLPFVPERQTARYRNAQVTAVTGARVTILIDGVTIPGVPVRGPVPPVNTGCLVLEQGNALVVLGSAGCNSSYGDPAAPGGGYGGGGTADFDPCEPCPPPPDDTGNTGGVRIVGVSVSPWIDSNSMTSVTCALPGAGEPGDLYLALVISNDSRQSYSVPTSIPAGWSVPQGLPATGWGSPSTRPHVGRGGTNGQWFYKAANGGGGNVQFQFSNPTARRMIVFAIRGASAPSTLRPWMHHSNNTEGAGLTDVETDVYGPGTLYETPPYFGLMLHIALYQTWQLLDRYTLYKGCDWGSTVAQAHPVEPAVLDLNWYRPGCEVYWGGIGLGPDPQRVTKFDMPFQYATATLLIPTASTQI